MNRSAIWITVANFRGWGCSECDWNYPVPTLLSEREAMSAYDRLSLAKFRDHECAEHPPRRASATAPSITERIRRLAARGYKPKDAIDLVLQEVQLEFRDTPEVLQAAHEEAEEFLRRVRKGII